MRRRQFIQKTILTLSYIGINPTIVFPKSSIEVSEFEDSWREYIKNTCNETAIAVYKKVPLYDTYDDEKKSRISNQIDIDADKLETHILTGNKRALDLAFKLFSITDGALSSFFNIITGPYMHIDPTYFLESLDRHYHLVEIKPLLGNYGLDLVDEFELQNIETKKRIESLSQVDAPKLQKLKQECIGHLQKKFVSQEIIDQVNDIT